MGPLESLLLAAVGTAVLIWIGRSLGLRREAVLDSVASARARFGAGIGDAPVALGEHGAGAVVRLPGGGLAFLEPVGDRLVRRDLPEGAYRLLYRDRDPCLEVLPSGLGRPGRLYALERGAFVALGLEPTR